MLKRLKREQQTLELLLIAVALALSCLVFKFDGYKMVVLNLFYLPVVLAGFYLGRYRAGVLALFCVISASLVTVLQLHSFEGAVSPLAMGLGVTVWGATLCLTSILVGTLSDERTAQAKELHEAYVGVVEVLSKYLQGGNPRLKARSERVAVEMKLPIKQIDDIRVACLMQDLGQIEVTTKVITKAVDSLEAKASKLENYSFQGTDLIHSLGTVLRGAIPILLSQENHWPASVSQGRPDDVPIGAKILRVVRTFDDLVEPGVGQQELSAAEAIADMRRDQSSGFDTDVLNALARVCMEFELTPA
jgi:HD-GYP domain-containing protein (c-di-GMP phosphodiesterase class II)